jgi:AcrR family transcriptional regulator
VTRWRPDARERLRGAALELFTEQGFAETTVPEIAARAGLTTRTFFRHYADKREVLFEGDEIPAYAAQLLAQVPAGLDPLAVIVEGLKIVAEARFEPRKDEMRQWRAIVRTDEGLRERDLRKRAALAEVMRDGFVGRGVDRTTAAVVAETGVTLLYVALDEWLDPEPAAGDGRTLHEIILQALERLRTALTVPPAE